MTAISAVAFLALLTTPPQNVPVPGIGYGFDPAVCKVADKYGVPRWLAMSLGFAESSLRANARSGSSRGYFQINARFEVEHAKRAGIKKFRWWDKEHSARAGIAYLAYLIERYNGDYWLAVAAYNMGPRKVYLAKKWPLETIEHVRRVLG